MGPKATHACAVRANSGQKLQREEKKPPATFEEPGANVACQEQKRHTEHAPWTQHHLRGGQNT